jgi:hypothetical protein
MQGRIYPPIALKRWLMALQRPLEFTTGQPAGKP